MKLIIYTTVLLCVKKQQFDKNHSALCHLQHLQVIHVIAKIRIYF